MNVLYFTDRVLSSKAIALVEFDIDSIRQIVAARHAPLPGLWLADPDQYECNGRILRDSTTPRLLGYSHDSKTLYVTDGCNSCAHELEVDLKTLTAGRLLAFAGKNSIRPELLEKLAAACEV